ncbi:hypothetical protein [Hyphomicrobium sp. LHD-15]|uniref:hypothetical protein n=1 Tax=Hyphomicrobium sp. LHD-15 TaxID=3072142 RepID=UPI00280C7C9D|nr:hypothetical protein [Hyphomicrobium sp. LHD-15]MDQ8697260.1 hypothetical protein [Hyphomicrobium sp. LHD-15]
MQVDDETWAAVRAAYADAAVPLKEIAVRFGLTPLAIGARAKREGWAGREQRQRSQQGRKSKVKKSGSKRQDPKPVSDRDRSRQEPAGVEATTTQRRRDRLPTRDARKSIVGRLYRAISLKLEHMEKRMASGDPRSAQDEERESRALATLINNFEKVTEAVAELDQDGGASYAASAAGADAERMRREIAERLERLGGSGALERGSRKSG